MKIINPKNFRFGPAKENAGLDGVTMFETIVGVLLKKGAVKVTGLGTFQIVRCKALGKKTINGKTYNVGEYNKIRFRATTGLRSEIQSYGKN